MTPVALVLIVGATVRVTRLLQTDSILDPVRDPLLRRARRSGAKAWELLWCPWCLSVWVGIAVAASWCLWGHRELWLAATAVATASYVTGWFAELEER